jgi:hypothetical protein
MEFKHSFKFADAKLNKRLLGQLRTANVRHSVDADGSIRYAADDEEQVENEFLGEIRDGLFSAWQLIFCPPGWAERYETYMKLHKVPFVEQWSDEQPCFLIPRQYRPHTWKLPNDRRGIAALIASGRRS